MTLRSRDFETRFLNSYLLRIRANPLKTVELPENRTNCLGVGREERLKSAPMPKLCVGTVTL